MSEAFIGEIRMFAGNFAPIDWSFCNGALIAISQNEALFALIGTTFGGDGVTTFALPNLQSRIPIHQGQGPGLSNRILGQLLGEENVTLTTAQLPVHTHAAPSSSSGNKATPGGNFWAADGSGNTACYSTQGVNGSMSANAINGAGGSQPHTNLQPYLAVNFIIALFGIFPTQN